MSDQVQHLIDRIRKDAVDTAAADGARVKQQAEADARATIDAANKRAEAIVADAEQRGHALVERGGKALEQAARDLLIGVGKRLTAMIDGLLVSATNDALKPEVVEQMLVRLCEGLGKNRLDDKSLMVAVGPGERDRIAAFASSKLRDALQKGVEVHVDQHLQKGFRVSFGNDTVRHEFTPAAIAQALAQLVRPQLAEVIQRAATGAAKS